MAGRQSRVGLATAAFTLLAVAFLSLFLIYPVGLMLRNAVIVNGRFSLSLFADLWTNSLRRSCVINSTFIGVTVTFACAVVSAPMAFLMARYDFRGKKWLTGLVLVPMIMPPFVGAIGMQKILSKNGAVDILLVKFLSWLHIVQPDQMGLVDMARGGLLGVIVLETLHLYPIMYLNVTAALANVDPAMEEAGRNLGASPWRLFRTITMPLAMPGFFAGAIIVFIWAFTDLGTPLIFNYPRVIPVQIYNDAKAINQNPSSFSLVVLVMLICACAFLLSKYFTGRRTYYMLAKDTRAKPPVALSTKGTVLAYAFLGGMTLVSVLPHISVILTSISKEWTFTVFPTQFTVAYYGDIFSRPETMSAIKNSLFYSAGSTVFDIVLGVGIAYVLARKRFFGASALDALAMMPLALPGFVVAFGYIAAFVGKPFFRPIDPFVNPTFLLMVSYSVRRLPFMVRSVYAGFQQVSPSLEEAAANVGATPSRVLRTITLPLVLANVLAGGILCFSFAMLEVSDSMILATAPSFYPVTKTIYGLSMDLKAGDNLAAAMGVLGMVLLVVSLVAAGKALGERMGELFRA
jgi:iron(III) transport system permease protein